MRTSFSLESVGDGKPGHLRPWVARIAGIDGSGFKREFVNGNRDYLGANGTGSRGIMVWWFLEDGLYEVQAVPRWNRRERYFMVIEYGQHRRVSVPEARAITQAQEMTCPAS